MGTHSDVEIAKRDFQDAIKRNAELLKEHVEPELLTKLGVALNDASYHEKYLIDKNEKYKKITGYPDYSIEHQLHHQMLRPAMPFYAMGSYMWENPFASPYPSLYQVINIATAGKCDIKLVGYDPRKKKVVDIATFFWDVHDITIGDIKEALSQTIGVPDARVYKVKIKKRIFRHPQLIVYLSTDDPIMNDDGMDDSGFHTYPNPEDLGYSL